MPKAHVKFETPKEVSDKVLQAFELARNNGKIRRGTNETTKALEKGQAKLVAIAEDVEPEEIVMHIPVICDEKKIPYVYVPHKLDLGRATGIDVSMACAGIVEPGDAKEILKELIEKIDGLRKK